MASANGNLLMKAAPRFLAVLFLTAVACAWTTSAVLAGDRDPGQVTMESQTDRGGSNYDMSEGGQAPDCQQKCVDSARCQAYTWVEPGAQGSKSRCYLKLEVPKATPCPHCVSGVKQAWPQGLDVKLYYLNAPPSVAARVDDRLPEYYPYRTATLHDGDVGAADGTGFYHIELLPVQGATAGGVQTVSDRFKLPAGAVCGFHHTGVTPGRTCMGMDAGQGKCPVGWRLRSHFDMSSGDGSFDCNRSDAVFQRGCPHFVWCEYLDPYKLCESEDCVSAVRAMPLVVIGIDSNVYPAGQTVRATCPGDGRRSTYRDNGRPTHTGISVCSGMF